MHYIQRQNHLNVIFQDWFFSQILKTFQHMGNSGTWVPKQNREKIFWYFPYIFLIKLQVFMCIFYAKCPMKMVVVATPYKINSKFNSFYYNIMPFILHKSYFHIYLSWAVKIYTFPVADPSVNRCIDMLDNISFTSVIIVKFFFFILLIKL